MTEYVWKADWIWGEGAESPRNEWRCFRKTFEAPASWEAATIKITADSRYMLIVNGQQVGRGPVRSWPFEQSYDTHEIGHLLQKDKTNSIAVFVQHFGVSNFYYIRGRGGLLAQLDITSGGGASEPWVITDTTWLTTKHKGHHTRTPRMSCQQAYSEYIDAGLWDDSWKLNAYNAAAWEQAIIVGPAGMEPWTKLKPRDIPLLTEETMYPVRVEALNQVKSFTWSTAIDLRNHMIPGSEIHANHIGFTSYVATNLYVAQPASIIIGFTHSMECFKKCSLNGQVIAPEAFSGTDPEKYANVQLRQGDNLLLIDVSGGAHTSKLHFGIYSEAVVEVKSPLASDTGNSAFISVGPFGTAVYIDHQDPPTIDFADETYLKVIDDVKSIKDLDGYASWLRPIDSSFVSESDVLSLNIWKKESIAHSVPSQLQNLVIPHLHPAVIPDFAGYDTEIVVDFGREYSGYLAFDLEAEAGVVVDLYGFEYMNGDYRQDTFGLDNTLRYVSKQGRQSYESPVRRGLRYLIITVRRTSQAPVKIFNVTIKQSNYPVAEIGKFQSSDPLLNDIWTISQHTTRLCMEDTFVDCPAFEQVFWVGDSRNEALVSNYLYGVNGIVKRCLRLVPGSKHETPLYMDQVPSGWSSVIPNWTFFWAIACYEYYQQTADKAFAQEMYPHIKFTLEHYQLKINANGLMDIKGWNLLDWSPIDQPNDGIVTHQNMFLAKTFLVAAEMAEIAEDQAGAAKFIKAGEALKLAINKFLWNDEKQAYFDCIHSDGRKSDIYSMQSQVVANLTGVATAERKQTIEKYLLDPPLEFVQIGSPFMSFFYYETLAAAGHTGKIVEDIRRNYGQMIDHGATTCWEMYPNFTENRANPDMLTRSHCHAWSSAPGYFLGTEVLGVVRTAPGWTQVTVAPNPSGLAWAKGTVPLPEKGRIDVSWQSDDTKRTIVIKVKHPKHIEVNVVIPEGYTGEIITSEV